MNKQNNKIIKFFKLVLARCLFIGLFPYSLFYFCILEIKKREEAKRKKYQESSYFKITNTPYEFSRFNKSAYAEYLLFEELHFLEEQGVRFLFNLYVPKPDGKTSEIDMLCISEQGIFVFENKDYSGWIFGSEKQKMWTQTFSGRYGVEKYHFYNPVMQNENHIKYLRSYLKADNTLPVFSVVVFSNHCELKNVFVNHEKVLVLQKHELSYLFPKVIKNQKSVLSDIEIEAIYKELFPLSHVDEETKNKHVEDIRKYSFH